MGHDATRTAGVASGVVGPAVVGTERTDEPFPFTTYVALASARDHLGPVTVCARHLPYGVWWDRLRPTIELVRPADPPADASDPDQPGGADIESTDARRLPLEGLWDDRGRFLGVDESGYASAAAAYRTGDGLF